MSLEEALEWLKGNRSTWNTFAQICEFGIAHKLSSETDAAITQQAYWIVRAHREGLIENAVDKKGGKQ